MLQLHRTRRRRAIISITTVVIVAILIGLCEPNKGKAQGGCVTTVWAQQKGPGRTPQ